MTKVYYSALWADLSDGDTVTINGVVCTIGVDAFNNYGEAAATGNQVQDLDTYFNTEYSSGANVTVYARGGSYDATVSNVASDTTNIFTNQAAAESAHASYYADGGIVIDGGTVSKRTFLNATQAKPYILKNYVSTGSDDQGLCLFALSTTENEGGYAVIGAGSSINTAYMGNRMAGVTKGTLKLEVVDDASIATLYTAGLYDAAVGDSTETYVGGFSTTVEVDVVNAAVSNTYVGAAGGRKLFANVTINADHASGVNVYGGGNTGTGSSAGGYTVNLTDSNYTGWISYYNPAKGTGCCAEGVVAVNAVAGTSTVAQGIALRNTDTITINADALLITGGVYAATDKSAGFAGTITVDTTGYSGSGAEKMVFQQTDSDITANFVLDDTTNYKLTIQNNRQVMLTPKNCYFSVTWAGLEDGTKVTVAGGEYTIGTDAFASYDLAVAAGAKFINSADTYLNSNYNDTDLIVVSGYTATFGVDAFADNASAVAAAKTMGGALDVTGGSFSGLNASGIETSIFSDVSTGTGASIWGQTEDVEIASKKMTATNVECNYFAAVTGGTVTGDVNVDATDLTTHNALYLVQNASACGNVTATISGKSFLTKGLCAVDDGATVGGDLTITVEGGEIYRRGIQNYGVVDGTSSVTVTGDATISSIMDNFDTVTIDEGVTLNYGMGLEDDWNNSYLYGFCNLVNNGTLNYNADLGQNAYVMLYKTLSGTGTIELGDNQMFVVGGTTYVAEMQNRVLINSDWSGKEMFDVIDVDGGTSIFGVSAFADKETAETSGLASDETTYIIFGDVIEGTAHGEDGHFGIAGGTITGTTFAGEEITEAEGTITLSSELVAMSTSNADGDYASLIGGYDIQEYADTTILADSSLSVSGAGTLTGKALVGGSYITASAVDWIGTSTVSVTSGTFSNALVGGALVNGENASISGTLNTNVTLSNATVKVLGGGCYLQNGGSIDVSGTTNVTLSNCTVTGTVFGGNFANKQQVSTKDTSLWNGNTNVTIDATVKVAIGGNLVAGSYGTGKVSGNTTITVTGNGANLTIGGHVTGDCSGGNDSASGKFVTGTRTLNFTEFNGTFGASGKKVTGFDAVALNNSNVTLAGNGMLKSVSDWQITDSTLNWTKGANDFSGDQLTLVYSNELVDEWTVFQLTDRLTTGWDEFTTDGSGIAKIILSINGEGTIAEFDDGANAYLGTISSVDYKFYLDTEDNALKVAKLA